MKKGFAPILILTIALAIIAAGQSIFLQSITMGTMIQFITKSSPPLNLSSNVSTNLP